MNKLTSKKMKLIINDKKMVTKRSKPRTAQFNGFRDLLLHHSQEHAWLYGTFSQGEVQAHIKYGWKVI